MAALNSSICPVPEGGKMQITICGGGNAAHVCIGRLGGRPELVVNLFTPLAHEVEKFAASPECKATQKDDGTEFVGKLNKVSANPADVIPGSRLIIVAVPAPFHEGTLAAIAPHCDAGACVGTLCARGGFDLAARDKFGDKASTTVFFGLQTLPWACRIEEFGKSAVILGTKKEIDMCTLPAEAVNDQAFREQLGGYFGLKLSPVSSFTAITLANVGQLIHPGITFGCWSKWDGKPVAEKPLFYQGVDDFTADVLQRMSDEVQAVKNAVEKETGMDLPDVYTLKHWLDRSYSSDISDSSSLKSAFNTNNAYQGLCHPMKEVEGGFVVDYNARYLMEDVPFGLVVTRGFADLVGVKTPAIDECIVWAQAQINKEYLVDGKLVGKDVAKTRAPQRYGFDTIKAAVGI